MVRRALPAIVTAALLALATLAGQLVPGRPAAEQALAGASPVASAIPVAGAFHAAAGFDLRLPPGWIAYDRSDMVNRRAVRELVIANAPIPLPVAPYEQIAFGTLDDVVVLELIEGGGPGGGGVEAESTFPLDWSAARGVPGGDGRAISLPFRHLLRSFTLTAHLGAAVRAGDRDALRDLVASVRPEPIPAGGVYRRWDVLGPLASFAIGSVTHFDTPQSAAGGFFLVRGRRTTYAFIDHAYLFMGAIKPCPLRYDTAERVFICGAIGERWSRVGKQLDGSGYFGLGYHVVLVKDGLLLVGGGSANGSSRNDEDEAAEFADPICCTASVAAALDRATVVARYTKLTTTTPTARIEAKLVPQRALAGLFRGALLAPGTADPLWLVAFSGPVRVAGGGDSTGSWTLFAVDPLRGGVVNAGCCEGGGDWPPGFDALPDLAPR